MCKDTVASLSDPVQYNSYGLSDGAWMRDARGHGNVIYLTSGHYSNNLLEFRDMDTFKSGWVESSSTTDNILTYWLYLMFLCSICSLLLLVLLAFMLCFVSYRHEAVNSDLCCTRQWNMIVIYTNIFYEIWLAVTDYSSKHGYCVYFNQFSLWLLRG